MLVSHRKKFIYMKTAKTAGTSVEIYFEPYCMRENEWKFAQQRDEYVSEAGIVGSRIGIKQGRLQRMWHEHMPAAQIKKQLGDELWNTYFKFCTIRNPFDKLVSGFHHFERRYKKFLRSNKKIKTLAGTTMKERFSEWLHYIEQIGRTDRDKYMIDNKICVDYFIRYENLENGIRHVCGRLAIPFEADRIPNILSGIRPAGRRMGEYYDAVTIAIVERLYAFELQHFEYTYPGD